MKITELFRRQKRTFSFEFFPPKNYSSTLELGINIGQLMKIDPSFVSVTYGAGGTTQELTFDLVDYIQNKIGLTTMAHYTCVNSTHEKVINDFNLLHQKNIENLMLLRGDLPEGNRSLEPIIGEFKHASELIELAKSTGHFCIGAAGYPEKHPESKDFESDIRWLRYKSDQGADFIITQMFFDNEAYFSFVNAAREAGIHQRIIPGIIPITNFKQIKKFSDLCGARIPEEIYERLTPIQNDPVKTYQTGVDIAIRQCIDLLHRGAPGLHFYTLNKSRATVDIFESIPHGLFH